MRMPMTSARRSVLVLSLTPIRALDGGATFTLNTARAIAAHGDDVLLAAPVDPLPAQTAHRARMACDLITARPGASPDDPWTVERLTTAALLDRCWTFDDIVVHQFLAADVLFDVIAALDGTQTLVLTSLGCEPLLPVFATFHQACPNHHVVSVSQAAAARLARQGVPSRPVYGGVWAGDITPAMPSDHGRYCAVGRLLPYKAYEVAVDALREGEELLHVGARVAGAEGYADQLLRIADKKRVRWLGVVDETTKRTVLTGSRALLACSQDLEDDSGHETRTPPRELLGLVLLEAVAAGVMPVASDVPAFQEVMRCLSLTDWVYPAGDRGALRERLDRLAPRGEAARRRQVASAQAVLRDAFTWDSYWGRVRQACDGDAS